jgi:ribosome-associated toxin RatA of RatAB toxin-antitoxin module
MFHPLGRPGSDQPACKIEFDLRYAFSSKALETVISPVFDRVANTFVDSFVQARRAGVWRPLTALRVEVSTARRPAT